MFDDDNNSSPSNPPSTTETGKTETQTDMPGKEFTISRVQDSDESVRKTRIQN